jgi:hypothetical protein
LKSGDRVLLRVGLSAIHRNSISLWAAEPATLWKQPKTIRVAVDADGPSSILLPFKKELTVWSGKMPSPDSFVLPFEADGIRGQLNFVLVNDRSSGYRLKIGLSVLPVQK